MAMISPYEGLAEKIRWWRISMERRGIIPAVLILAHSDREGLAEELHVRPEERETWNDFEGLVVIAGPYTMLGVPVKIPR